MMSSWWMLWMIFLFVFLLPPIGYGWGYRRWGPPYPRYVQQRRAAAFAGGGGSGGAGLGGPAPIDHHAWGWAGDYVWIMLLVGVMWASMAFYWR